MPAPELTGLLSNPPLGLWQPLPLGFGVDMAAPLLDGLHWVDR